MSTTARSPSWLRLALRDPALQAGEDDDGWQLVKCVMGREEPSGGGPAVLWSRRRALYTEAVRRAILDVATSARSKKTPELWSSMHGVIGKHPCFTEEERARVGGLQGP